MPLTLFPRRQFFVSLLPLFMAGTLHAAAPLVLRKQMIPDTAMGIDAFSILVPDGWKLDSNIGWDQIKPVPFVTITETNPDLHATWKHYPRGFYVDGVRENFERIYPRSRSEIEKKMAEGNQTARGEIIHKLPNSPKEMLDELFIPASFPDIANDKNAKAVSTKDMPDVAQSIQQHDMLHRPAQVNMVRYEYTTPDGPMETQFIAMMSVSDMRPQNPHQPNPGPNYFYVTDVISFTAPRGKLDGLLATFNAINSSLSQQLPWFNVQVKIGQEFLQKQQQQMQQALQANQDRLNAESQMLQDQRDALNQRMQIVHNAGVQEQNNISDSIRQNFANQQAAKADSQDRFMHYITDTNNYKDVNDGSTVNLPSNKYVYEDNHGDFIGTDDATYHPPVDPSTSWQQVDKIN